MDHEPTLRQIVDIVVLGRGLTMRDRGVILYWLINNSFMEKRVIMPGQNSEPKKAVLPIPGEAGSVEYLEETIKQSGDGGIQFSALPNAYNGDMNDGYGGLGALREVKEMIRKGQTEMNFTESGVQIIPKR